MQIIGQTLIPTSEEQKLFSNVQEVFLKVSHTTDYKENIDKFQLEIMIITFSDNNLIHQAINRIAHKHIHIRQIGNLKI